METAIALTLLTALAGCGEEPPADPIDELTRYLPAGEPGFVTIADLATVREQLGLPADGDALDFDLLLADDYDPAAPKVRLLEAARIPLGSFGFLPSEGEVEVVPSGERIEREPVDLELEVDPVTEAFDGRAISAAATGEAAGDKQGPVTAIRTAQPFEELARALEDEGYVWHGDVVSRPGAKVTQVVDAGGGIFVIGGQVGSATNAVAEPAGGPVAPLELIEPADEPVTSAVAGFHSPCVTGYGGWQEATGETGAFRIAVDGTAETDRVELHKFERFTRTELGEPSVDGEYAEIPFTDGGEDGSSPLRDLQTSLGDLYDCE